MEKGVLSIADYVLLGIMLLISAAIGVYFMLSGGKQKTTEEYLLAGKNMSVLPVSFSLMASAMSAVTAIGNPAETYQYGTNYFFIIVGYSLGIVISAYLSLPLYFELQNISTYEYLEERFGKTLRTLTSIMFIIQTMLYMTVVVYGPALALSAVTNLSIWASVILIGAVCTFYCTLGGMKAVLWTDVFQALLMYTGTIAVLIVGFINIGFLQVFQIANTGGRLKIPGLEVDPTVKYTMWNLFLQGMVLSTSLNSTNQILVQRLLTVNNLKKAKIALFWSVLLNFMYHSLSCLVGIVIYAAFANCDPLTDPEKPISKPDQLLPFYIMSALNQYPGLPGVCICGIFSSSLSSVSSALNSLTAVTMEDIFKPVTGQSCASEKTTAFAIKTMILFYGVLCMALTFLVSLFDNLMQAALTLYGITSGPILAVFLLGMITTRSNEKGAIIGLVLSVAFSFWLAFGPDRASLPSEELPTSIDGCSSFNSTTEPSPLLNMIDKSTGIRNVTNFVKKETSDENIFILYKISYLWLLPFGFILACVIGYVASILIQITTRNTSVVVSRKLLSPIAKRFHKCREADEDRPDATNHSTIKEDVTPMKDMNQRVTEESKPSEQTVEKDENVKI